MAVNEIQRTVRDLESQFLIADRKAECGIESGARGGVKSRLEMGLQCS